MSNKKQRVRKVVELALQEREEELRQLDRELNGLFNDSQLFEDWPFDDYLGPLATNQPIDWEVANEIRKERELAVASDVVCNDGR